MFYTVIQKSGWNTDSWHVAETFTSKQDAQAYASENQQPNARNDFYRTEIKSHRKQLTDLANWDNMTVKFSDGTQASY